jgi:hypothetical protein
VRASASAACLAATLLVLLCLCLLLLLRLLVVLLLVGQLRALPLLLLLLLWLANSHKLLHPAHPVGRGGGARRHGNKRRICCRPSGRVETRKHTPALHDDWQPAVL